MEDTNNKEIEIPSVDTTPMDTVPMDTVPMETLPMEVGIAENSPKIDPVKYIYDDVKKKADKRLSNLDSLEQKNQEESFFSGMFQEPASASKLSFQENRIDIDEAYTKLSDNTYVTRYDKGYTLGIDNEQAYAEENQAAEARGEVAHFGAI